MFYFLTFIGLAIAALSWTASQKRRGLRDIQAMFVRYNDAKDISIITDWIAAGNPAKRLVTALEYLEKIEMHDLAAELAVAINMDRQAGRYARVLATRAYKRKGDEQRATAFINDLLADYSGDDSILDLAIDVYLHFEALDKAKSLLLPRLERKFEGTIFARHHARLLALEGNFDEAVTIMEKVKDQDYNLYRNTFAQPQKRLIYDQYEESCHYLEMFQNRTNAVDQTSSQK